MADLVGAILEIVKCIATPTCNYVYHCKKFHGDVKVLKDKLADLNARKCDIESTIQVGEMVKEEVQRWIQHVQTINGEVQPILDKAEKAKWYRKACLGKHVCRKIDAVNEIHNRGSFTGGLVIAKPLSPPPPPPSGSIILTENLEGEKATRAQIWKYLMGDEVGMIGVCGIGGVGKTTIMKHVHNDLVKGNRFQKVIWVTVSYPLNIFELQKKIALAIGKTLREDEEEMRWATTLMEIMQKMRFVLILDDVWEKFSLKDVGIPEPTVQNGCKIVITSRSVEVCNYLGCKIVKVQPLSPEESLNLFLNKVGCDVLEVPGLEEILKSIVEECDGLPLAIVVIAGSMKGEYDIIEWRNSLNELRQCVKSVKGVDDEIFMRLRFTYDRLRSLEIQKCFLYCSLFQEDYDFFREELIEGWIDEALIDELGGRQKAYDRGQAFINRLEKNCLLEKTVNQLGYDVVKMHDVVRDMAIKSIGPEVRYMVKSGMKLIEVPNEHEWTSDLNKVSLMANDISEIPVGLSPKCPSLSTLRLSNNPLTEIPESFFEDMSGLKVLDLSRTNIEALPGSISKLESLSALWLRSCERLKCLPSLEKLVALKKLDLKWAGIEVVPQGMEMLVSLEYLDFCCRDLKEIPMGILSKLSSLQYLVATDYFYECNVKIKLEEVARLRKLEILNCNLDDMQDFNYFLSEFNNFQSFIAYTLMVGTRNYKSAHDPKNKCILIISGCDIGKKSIVLPDNLQQLFIHECKNMRSSLNKTVLLENATKLNLCIISDCEETEYVVELDSSSSSLCSPVLSKLESLYLWDLPRLWALVRVEGVATPPRVFSNLQSLQLIGCSRMRKLLPLELLQALQNLEAIVVSHCEQMEEIIASSDSDASSDKFTFPKLRELHLYNLPQLKSICSGKGIIVCDSIEEIWISSCRELKRIPVQLPPLDNGQPSPPPRLREINIKEKEKDWWESVEWDHPNAKNLLQPFLKYSRGD